MQYIFVMIYFAINNQSLIFFLIQVNQGPTTRCKDEKKSCRSWRKQGYCTKKNHVRYMKTNCKKSCNLCDAVWNGKKSTSKTPCDFYSDFNWFIKDIWMMYTLINCFKNVVFWTFPISHSYHVTTICNDRHFK